MMTDNCHRVNTYCIMPCHTHKRIGDIIKNLSFFSYFFIIYKNIIITGNLFFYIIYKCDIYICVYFLKIHLN